MIISTTPRDSSREQADLQKWTSRHRPQFNSSSLLYALPGDASSRKYYRCKIKNETFLIMKMQSFATQGQQLPFLQVQKHLLDLGVSVPRVFEVDPKQGIIMLEDLGDETLLKRLEGVTKKNVQVQWFKKAIDLNLKMQIRATIKSAPIDAYGLYFDEEKLMWEVGFTLAHFYGGSLARKIPAKDEQRIQKHFQSICKELASQDWYFSHRDYHSRNIMISAAHDEQLYLIDFQDARLGCAQYDLASLLRDSYYQLDEEIVYELVDYYVRAREKMEDKIEDKPGKKSTNKKEFIRIFDLMSIQRNFKAIGSFASFYTKKQDVRYLKFIGNTFENIRRNLVKYPELEELRTLLFRYYYF